MAAADIHLLAAELDRPASVLQHRPADLPDGAWLRRHPCCVSRRVRDASLSGLYAAMLRDLLIRDARENYFIIDSKALPIAAHSTDVSATVGPASGFFARGYRLHTIVDRYEQIWTARVTPMNVSETSVAPLLFEDLAALGARGLLLADRGYDAMAVFDAARRANLVLLCPRRVTACNDPDPRRCPARFRSFLILEKFPKSHGTIRHQFVKLRDTAERAFAHLCGRSGGLTGLPPWVRTMPRVRAWVLAKMVLHATRQRRKLLNRMTTQEGHA